MDKRENLPAQAVPARLLRFAAVVAVAVLLLSLLPLYGAAAYSYPGPDDFRYGRTTRRVWQETGSVGALLGEAARVTGETYRTWQGSYAAIFLMALEPGIFSEEYYGAATYLLLTALVCSVFFFVYTAVVVLFCQRQGEPDEAALSGVIFGALAAFGCVQFVPSPADAYFWFNGGVYYTFFFSLSLLIFAILIRRSRKRSVPAWVFLPLLAVAVGGGNLVTAFLSAGLLLLYVLWQGMKKRVDPLVALTAVLLLVAFAVNAFAPGNGVRQAEHAESALAPLAAILAAIRDAWRYTGEWLQNPGTFLLLAGAPLGWRLAGRTEFRFRYPIFVTVFSFLLLAAGFTPTEYALGFAGEARLVDIQYDLFLLLLLWNVLWYGGWLRQRLGAGKPAFVRWAGVGVCALCLLLCCVQTLRQRNSASVSAARILTNGSAASYGAVWDARLSLLRDETKATVLLPAFDTKPPLLCTLDVTPGTGDEYYWYNQQLEAYYGKEQVLRERTPED